MKKTLSILLAVALCFTMFATFAAAAEGTVSLVYGEHAAEDYLSDFIDAPAMGSWQYQPLNCAVASEIIVGHDSNLRPDDSITRAELATVIARVVNAQGLKADLSAFSDVEEGAWYYDYVASCVAANIMNGSGNKIMPNAPITREQTFALIARTFLLIPEGANAYARFNDANQVSAWARYATNALIEADVVRGDSSNTLRPGADITRAELAAMLDRIVCYFADSAVNYNGAVIEGSVIVRDPAVDLSGATINGDIYFAEGVGNADFDLSNVTINGRIVVRSGDVTVPQSMQEQVVLPEDYNEEPQTPPVVDDGKDDEEEKPSGDDNQSDANDSPNSASVPSSKKDTQITSSYITYDDGQKLYADVSGNTVTFDFTELDVETAVLEELYVKSNVTAACVHPLATFNTNTVNDIAPIIAEIPNKTNNQLVPIEPGQEYDLSLLNLSTIVCDARDMYQLQDMNNDYLFRDLFTAKGITIEEIDENTIKTTFTGKIGNDTFKFVIITEVYIAL